MIGRPARIALIVWACGLLACGGGTSLEGESGSEVDLWEATTEVVPDDGTAPLDVEVGADADPDVEFDSWDTTFPDVLLPDGLCDSYACDEACRAAGFDHGYCAGGTECDCVNDLHDADADADFEDEIVDADPGEDIWRPEVGPETVEDSGCDYWSCAAACRAEGHLGGLCIEDRCVCRDDMDGGRPEGWDGIDRDRWEGIDRDGRDAERDSGI